MYRHHRESLENLKSYFSDREEVIAVIFGGKEYELRGRENRTAETIER